MKRLLPIGIQDFVTIREEGFVYVDKTARIHELAAGSGRAFFLSRPRRFGKSLLCSTLGAVFEGRRELFGEIAGRPALAIDSLEWGWKKHPVIRIDMNSGDYANDGIAALRAALSRQLKGAAEKHGVVIDEMDDANRFASLIEKCREKAGEKAVVIIDEYDKPLLETIDDTEVHKRMKGALKAFYGMLKSMDKHLRFVLLTGVSKFAQVSVFSDLNHLVDLTLHPAYADICGITQEELEACFEPEIQAVLEATGRRRETYMEELRKYYNGYRFTEKPLKMYNPFGLLNHFNENGKFKPYWYETGTPSFLIKLVVSQKTDIVNLGKMQVRHEDFRKYDIENMRVMPLLYQTGYLTIVDCDGERDRYTLDYPNEEVRASFALSLLEQYMQVPEIKRYALVNRLPEALEDGDIEEAVNTLRRFLAAIPYDIISDSENYYETATYIIFTMLGLIGINFDSGKRNIGEWKHSES